MPRHPPLTHPENATAVTIVLKKFTGLDFEPRIHEHGVYYRHVSEVADIVVSPSPNRWAWHDSAGRYATGFQIKDMVASVRAVLTEALTPELAPWGLSIGEPSNQFDPELAATHAPIFADGSQLALIKRALRYYTQRCRKVEPNDLHEAAMLTQRVDAARRLVR